MNAIKTLEYLERIEKRNAAWIPYIIRCSLEVQRWIIRLRLFAARKPATALSAILAIRADRLQARLDTVLSKESDA